MTLVFRNDLPTFLDIIISDLALELAKLYSMTQYSDGNVLQITPADLSVTTVNVQISTVNSLAIWKMCEALDLKVNFVPLSEATTLSRTLHRGVNQTTIVPVVGSFSVLKMYQALDLPANYPNINQTTIFRKRNKPTPVVHSTAFFNYARR
ncbi:hypothetical protein TNIN_426021 [Trichonephila inaurata madagascariensis]|uniref:Uncharacterized protein n=1 Tax=Trichonephila inaurata madagascariensis TaxID=2747483 RepID=A0A8X6YQI5_9ARAC|nr:hypothetical protein TNIN_376861 [Trichonephila inaurata madagascariensis]GFY74717.1 hypothetical protein TNIN_426021 [Trichonephila inaurata madagascariensis]